MKIHFRFNKTDRIEHFNNLQILHLIVVTDFSKTQLFHVLPVMVQSKELCLIKSKKQYI